MKTLLMFATLLAATHADAAMQASPVEWSLDGTTFQGHLVYEDAGARRPGLLMVPNWMGANASAVERARAIAERGYVVLVADVYGKDVRPTDTTEAGAAARKMYADIDVLRARARKALDVLREQAANAPLDTDDLGAIGFCFGGATVLELARSGVDLDAVVTFHGSLDTPQPAGPGDIRSSLLVLNGAADSYVSAEHIAGFQQEMTAAGADWTFVNLADAVHCFAEPGANSPPGCVYHPRAAQRSYRMMDGFLAEAFGEDD